MSRKTLSNNGFVFFIFLMITLIMTYPALTNLTNLIIGDKYDSLLNAWILAWDAHKITSAEWLSIFEANIFYPQAHTLAYSEHLLGIAIWAWPIHTLFHNPVLTYNIAFLVNLTLSAFGMYLLVLDITGNKYSAIISGLIFGFFPWRFAHLPHVQLQASQWIPLTLLYLHRVFKKNSTKNLLLFTLFFILQFLSCGYLGIYLTFFVGLFFIWAFFHERVSLKKSVIRLGIFILCSGLFIFPISYPYLQVKQDLGFTRPLGETIYFSADLMSYLCTPQINRLWGEITQTFWKPEGELFLGLTAISLAITGLLFSLKREEGPKRNQNLNQGKFSRLTNIAVTTVLLFYSLVALGIFLTGGFSINWWGLIISATSLNRPLLIILITGGIKKLLTSKSDKTCFWRFGFRFRFTSPIVQYYFWVLLLSFLFSFGPRIQSHGQEIFHFGPYIILYKLFPGFAGLRDPARIVIMVALSISLFAGIGIMKILSGIRRRMIHHLLFGCLCTFILFEYICFPIPMTSIPTGNNIPPVYKWLSREKGDFPILEIPLPETATQVGLEAERVYFSAYHWKKLVNGYSGYFPASYNALYQKGIKGIPNDQSLTLLARQGLKYIIVHLDEFQEQDREFVENRLRSLKGIIRPLTRFGETLVYELVKK